MNDHDHSYDETCETCEANKLRRVQSYVDQGIDRSDAIMIDELAVHATRTAIESISNIADTAPIHLISHVHTIAMRLCYVNIGAVLEHIMNEQKRHRAYDGRSHARHERT